MKNSETRRWGAGFLVFCRQLMEEGEPLDYKYG